MGHHRLVDAPGGGAADEAGHDAAGPGEGGPAAGERQRPCRCEGKGLVRGVDEPGQRARERRRQGRGDEIGGRGVDPLQLAEHRGGGLGHLARHRLVDEIGQQGGIGAVGPGECRGESFRFDRLERRRRIARRQQQGLDPRQEHQAHHGGVAHVEGAEVAGQVEGVEAARGAGAEGHAVEAAGGAVPHDAVHRRWAGERVALHVRQARRAEDAVEPGGQPGHRLPGTVPAPLARGEDRGGTFAHRGGRARHRRRREEEIVDVGGVAGVEGGDDPGPLP
ncbi:MAG: hypothetical protein EBV05_13800, partial [Cyanobacteria bacterium WB6_1B_304]|nr:hypothetical protein [Cyanobacteria bacterium WB6_1B_304]